MRHLGTQTIETERLILRKARPEDARALFDNWASDERVTEFMTWQPYAKPEEAEWRISYLLSQYANDNFYEWHIELKEIGQPIGSIGAVHVDDNVRLAHIGYCMGCRWWGQGSSLSRWASTVWRPVTMWTTPNPAGSCRSAV